MSRQCVAFARTEKFRGDNDTIIYWVLNPPATRTITSIFGFLEVVEDSTALIDIMGTMQSTLTEVSWEPFQQWDGKIHSSTTVRSKDVPSTVSPSVSSSSLTSHQSNSGGNSPAQGSPSSSTSLNASLHIKALNAPVLYEDAQVGDWESLRTRINSHPKEARYQDKCKNMPLHVACRRQPPHDMIEALIQAHPAALTSPTLDKMTPLHFACFCGSDPATIQVLLRHERQGSKLRDMVDRRGRTPLHCVCSGFRSSHRLDVVRLLLKFDPSCAVVADERGRTPLSLLADDYAEELQAALTEETSSQDVLESCQEENGFLYECWQVTMLLLRAAYRGTIDDEANPNCFVDNEVKNVDGEFQELHAAVGVEACPLVLIRLVLKAMPESVRSFDPDSNLPLHIASRTNSCRLAVVDDEWTAPSTGEVYNCEFGPGLMSDSLRGSMTTSKPSISRKSSSPREDVTVDLLNLYPEAAAVPDEFGKLPFILSVEAGKNFKTCLQPLWKAHPAIFEVAAVEEDQSPIQALQSAIDGAITSISPSIRRETVQTLCHLATMWPPQQVDGWIIHMIDFAASCGGFDTMNNEDDMWGNCMHVATLEAVAAVLGHVDRTVIEITKTPQMAIDMAKAFLSRKDENIRLAAAHVIGLAISMLDKDSNKKTIIDEVVFGQDENDAASVSTMSFSVSSEEDGPPELLHGRAATCSYILQLEPFPLSSAQKRVIKSWIKHKEVIVRKAACFAAASSVQEANDVKEFRSPLLKCMRATEDVDVHLALARGLAITSKRHPKLFLNKNGLALIDGALMLSQTATRRSVQRAFHVFLYWALQLDGLDGLKEYRTLAGESNGKIMVQLATTTLSNLQPSAEDEELGLQRQRACSQ